MAFERTVAVIDKTIKDLAKISYWITVSVQVVFLVLYGYKIVVNLDKMFYLVIYCVLAVVSIFGFIYFLKTYKNKKQKVISGTKFGVRVSKYLANAAMTVVILIEFAQYGATELEIVVSGVSIVSFAVQIVFEFVRLVYSKYSELISTAINMDTEKYITAIDKLSNRGELFLSVVDAPLKSMSNKISGIKEEKRPRTKVEIYIDQLAANYQAKKKESKAKRVKKEKDNIREHLSVIFQWFKRKKSKKEDLVQIESTPKKGAPIKIKQIEQKKES